MRINHNIPALNSYKKYSSKSNSVAKSLEKLSSGLSINRASDNAAGLAISEKMRGQIRGLDQASSNATDTISLIQTAEGALNETHSALQRIRELTIQAANDTNTTSDRMQIQKEVDQLITSIDDNANNTEFNTKKLLDGSLSFQPAIPEVPSTSSFDFQGGTTGITLADDWVSWVTTWGAEGAKIKLNSGEDVTPPSGLSDMRIALNISFDNGLPTGFELTNGANSIVALYDQTGSSKILSYSCYGVTIDVSQAAYPGFSGYAYQGYVLLYKGHNGSPGTPAIDNSLYTQIGANTGQTIKIDINDMSANSLGIDPLDITTQSNANTAISAVDSAISLVSSERGKLGAVQNRLDHAIANNSNFAH